MNLNLTFREANPDGAVLDTLIRLSRDWEAELDGNAHTNSSNDSPDSYFCTQRPTGQQCTAF